jgi:hypothetical protein
MGNDNHKIVFFERINKLNEFIGDLQMSKLLKGVTKKTFVFAGAGAVGGFLGCFIFDSSGFDHADFVGNILDMALWGLCLGVLIIAAILTAQGVYLKRVPKAAVIVKALLSGIVAGAFSSALGQFIFSYASTISEAVTWVSRAFCWGILGAGLGFGVALFVPNFPKKRAMLAGFIGGFIGGFINNAVSPLLGSFILGFFIGITISILEEALREAWLTVVWGPKETRNISLGATPVKFGTSPESDIYVPDPDKNHNPIRAIFKLENNKVVIEDPVSGRRSELQNSKQINMGKMSIIVNMKKDKVAN